ncbi:MAG TPA: tetratricopeptide repeat protein [Pyrinomonadaceae bacterium]|jgi:tetratricopeptide (TPR) repeat protein|nr:tetratricopeptide repeat protein [Pyrinomonadaceae bacterium]
MLRHPLKILCTLLLAFSVAVAAQDDERQRAFQLYKDGKHIEAMPLFEKLAAANPKDRDVIEALGLMTASQTAYLKDPAARKKARVRARELLLRAQELGANSALLKWMLESVVPEGGEDNSSFSAKKEVDDAMREGEAAFVSNDMPKALEMYHRALILDPKLYEAALFIGDVYFKTSDHAKAGEWFGHAIAIDPDRETAYRYWGDSLMRQGRLTEAGEKFVEAYIADPYSRLSRAGFLNWGNKAHINLAHPRVDIPTNVTSKDKSTTITLDANMLGKDDKTGATAAWMFYGIIRASWQSEFAKQYPDEKTYRHSLKEEAAALRGALEAVKNQKLDPKNIDPSLQILQKLDSEGLLEAFVLLALPDEGIAQDFHNYRQNNLEKLRRYVKAYVLTGGGKQ